MGGIVAALVAGLSLGFTIPSAVPTRTVVIAAAAAAEEERP